MGRLTISVVINGVVGLGLLRDWEIVGASYFFAMGSILLGGFSFKEAPSID